LSADRAAHRNAAGVRFLAGSFDAECATLEVNDHNQDIEEASMEIRLAPGMPNEVAR
jgi:hypothetical protein